MAIETQVKQYILENFMFTDDASVLDREASLFDSGVIDSTGALELVGFIEETFAVQVEDVELVPDNFDSLVKITSYIERKLKAA